MTSEKRPRHDEETDLNEGDRTELIENTMRKNLKQMQEKENFPKFIEASTEEIEHMLNTALYRTYEDLGISAPAGLVSSQQPIT